MNSDIAEGKWKQVKGKLQQKWGKLTDDDMDKAEGSREELVGIIQEKYGYSKEEAKKEVSAYIDSL